MQPGTSNPAKTSAATTSLRTGSAGTRRTLIPAALAVLGACGGADAWTADLAAAECTLYEECGYLSYLGVESAAACEEVVASDPCGDWDAAAGEACLEGLETLDCQAFEAGSWPTACLEACDGSG